MTARICSPIIVRRNGGVEQSYEGRKTKYRFRTNELRRTRRASRASGTNEYRPAEGDRWGTEADANNSRSQFQVHPLRAGTARGPHAMGTRYLTLKEALLT